MKKSYVAVTSVLFLALALTAYSERGAIMLKILPGALDKIMSQQPLAELPDGLHISLCGAGGPMPSDNRSGPCVAVMAGEQLFVVDAGTNGARNLGRMGFNQGKIEALFLTHFHSDHIDGLGEMAMLRWVADNNSGPLPVYGPAGVAEIVSGFNRAYAQDAVHRTDHHGVKVAPPSGAGMSPKDFALPKIGESVTVYSNENLQIEMISADHFPVTPAVAYKFTYKGRSLLISGDTVKSPSIEKHSAGVDLLVHEALSTKLMVLMAESAARTGNPLREKLFNDTHNYHTTPVEAAEIARDARVGHLLYYHIVPALMAPGMEAIWLEGVEEVFSAVTLGQDGTSISMPANSREIIHQSSLL
ncbi:ribonuclease Z [Gammaproteobacteria bacterium MOLA455]|nr:ribonuclease Z [Gammaproteobacteria bacterium MOLA455]